jgi:hypothetical protein
MNSTSAIAVNISSIEKYFKMFKLEYRAVIKFLTKEGESPAEIKRRLDAVYGESSPSYSTVKE